MLKTDAIVDRAEHLHESSMRIIGQDFGRLLGVSDKKALVDQVQKLATETNKLLLVIKTRCEKAGHVVDSRSVMTCLRWSLFSMTVIMGCSATRQEQKILKTTSNCVDILIKIACLVKLVVKDKDELFSVFADKIMSSFLSRLKETAKKVQDKELFKKISTVSSCKTITDESSLYSCNAAACSSSNN